MDFSVEDVVMYALEHNMLGAVKYALTNQQNCAVALGTLCQTCLVITTMPRAVLKTSSAAQFVNGDHILAFSQILRSLKFIRTNWKKSGGFKYYAFCSIKLQKVIVMHLICSAPDPLIVKQQLTEGFGPEAMKHLASASTNERLVSVLKREISSFRQLCEKFLLDDTEKMKYIQGQMWFDFNKEFWVELDKDLTTYLEIVKSTFPQLKIEKVFQQDIDDFDTHVLQTLKSKVNSNMDILEEDLICLIDSISTESAGLENCCQKSQNGDLSAGDKGSKQKCEPLHTTRTFYGCLSKAQKTLSVESRVVTQILSQEKDDKVDTCVASKKRKFVASPKDQGKPAKRCKMLSAHDAAALLAMDSDEDEESENDSTLGEQPVTTNIEKNTANKHCAADCNASCKQLVDPCGAAGKQTDHQTDLEVSENKEMITKRILRSTSKLNRAFKKKPADQTSKKTTEIVEKCAKWRVAEVERPVTRSWQKSLRQLRPRNDAKMVCSSPKLNRRHRDMIRENRKPLSRRKLMYKTERPNANEKEEINILDLKSNVNKIDVNKNQAGSDVELDISEYMTPISDDEYVSESDCSSDNISVNLNLVDDQFPDFALLPAKQKCYSPGGWEPKVRITRLSPKLPPF